MKEIPLKAVGGGGGALDALWNTLVLNELTAQSFFVDVYKTDSAKIDVSTEDGERSSMALLPT